MTDDQKRLVFDIIFQQVLVTTPEISPETLDKKLVDDLTYDDLDFVELIMELEDQLNIFIEDDDVEKKWKTVSDVIEYVEKIVDYTEAKQKV